MKTFQNNMSNYKWAALFCLWAFHGIIEGFYYSPLFKESLGFSISDISIPYFVVGVFLIFWVVINVSAFIAEVFAKPRYIRLRVLIVEFLIKRRDLFFFISSIFLCIGLFTWLVYAFFSAYPSTIYDNYFRIVMPIVNIVTYVNFEVLLLFFWSTLSVKPKNQYPSRSFFLKLIIVLLTLTILSILIAVTNIGIVPSYPKGDWSRGLPAVPLLEWQIVVAFIFMVCFRVLELRKRIFLEQQHSEVWICILIWILAIGVWLSQPVIPNASALKPHEPNFEIYPFLDAQTYDQYAQSVLIGNGYGDGNIPQRPFYIVFLVFAHLFAGQDYEKIVMVQTAFLAFFPVLLYILGKEFFGRPIGLSIALLAIFRDYTSNLVSPFTGNLTYTKVLLAEIPVAIFLVLFLIIGIRWIRSDFSNWLGFFMGGVLGLAVLIRTQAIVALLAILFVSFFVVRKNTIIAFIKSSIVLLVGIMLVVSPWIIRNWTITGDFIFDNPESQTLNLALRYGRLNEIKVDLNRYSGETAAEYNKRLSQIASQAFWTDPLHSFWGISNAFLNHCINNILMFPLRYELKSPQDMLTPVDAFWERWEGNSTFIQAMLMAFYILLFGLGVAAAWHRYAVVGLLPLILNLLYNLWTSLALLSGQRFMVTMDWSIYLYYMIGLFSLVGAYLALLNNGRLRMVSWFEKKEDKKYLLTPIGFWFYPIFSLSFLLLGTLPLLVEHAFPNKYPNISNEQVAAKISDKMPLIQNDFDLECFQRLDKNNSISFIHGRALYPRYYTTGDGESITDAVGYKIVDMPRLVFEIVGQSNARVIFPLAEVPAFFPHASDVTLIYGEDASLWFIYVEKATDAEIYTSQSFDSSICK